VHRLLSNFTKYRFLLKELVKKDIKLKYRNSILGIVWTLLEPLLTMIVLTIVFTVVLERERPSIDFPVYVLVGRLLYGFFSSGTRLALKSVRNHSSMIRKVYVPKYIYPLATSLSSFVTFLISLIVLVAVAAVRNIQPTFHLFEAVIPIVALLLLTTGVGLVLATLDVFFRDLEYLWGVIMMMIMYTSAIFYETDKFFTDGGWKMWLFKLNPLYAIITNFRNSIFGEAPDVFFTVYSLGFGVAAMLIGVILFYKKQDEFILYI